MTASLGTQQFFLRITRRPHGSRDSDGFLLPLADFFLRITRRPHGSDIEAHEYGDERYFFLRITRRPHGSLTVVDRAMTQAFDFSCASRAGLIEAAQLAGQLARRGSFFPAHHAQASLKRSGSACGQGGRQLFPAHHAQASLKRRFLRFRCHGALFFLRITRRPHGSIGSTSRSSAAACTFSCASRAGLIEAPARYRHAPRQQAFSCASRAGLIEASA